MHLVHTRETISCGPVGATNSGFSIILNGRTWNTFSPNNYLCKYFTMGELSFRINDSTRVINVRHFFVAVK